jgi:signal transduction histidine kinase
MRPGAFIPRDDVTGVRLPIGRVLVVSTPSLGREQMRPEVGSRSRLGVKEEPMSPTDDRDTVTPSTVPDEASGGEADHQVDGAWRVWETLRDWDQRYALAVDVALALGLFLVCSGVFGLPDTRVADIGFVAGLTLPLVVRRRAPLAVFTVLAIVSLVQLAVTGPLLADAALLVALYTVSAESEWIGVVVAALTLEIGVILATVHWEPIGNYFKSLVFLTSMGAAALLGGIVVRALRSQLGWLAERADRLEFERDQQASLAAAAERARIAREMHDVVSHNIQVMVTLADGATVAQRSDPDRAAEAMREVSGTGRQALGDMRRLLGLLRQDVPGHGHRRTARDADGQGGPGTAPFAPQPGLDQLDELVERVRSTGLPVSLESSGEPFELSGAAGLTVYRIVQEALTNVLKHAPSAGAVKASLVFHDPEVTVQVTDDGGLHVPGVPDGADGGHGVEGMTERAAAFGGTLIAGPQADGGWMVAATLHDCRAPVHS